MLALPEPDVPRTKFSRALTEAMLLAEECIEIHLPTPPKERDADTLEKWSNTVLQEWIRHKSTAMLQAQDLLDKAAYVSHRELIIAGAVMGLINEDAASELLKLPLPAEVEKNPGDAELYTEVRLDQTEPYVRKAERAYFACAENADAGPDSMRHWQDFCRKRRDRLRREYASFFPTHEWRADGNTAGPPVP